MKDITVWDLFDIPQMNQAAVSLSLSKIYFNFSDGKDDVFKFKSDNFNKQYLRALDNTKLALDLNDDGKKDTPEQQVSFKVIRRTR